MKNDPPKKKKSAAQRASKPTRLQGETYESKLLNKNKVRTKLKPTPESTKAKNKAMIDRNKQNRKNQLSQNRKMYQDIGTDDKPILKRKVGDKERDELIKHTKDLKKANQMRYKQTIQKIEYGKKRTKLSDIEKAKLKKKS